MTRISDLLKLAQDNKKHIFQEYEPHGCDICDDIIVYRVFIEVYLTKTLEIRIIPHALCCSCYQNRKYINFGKSQVLNPSKDTPPHLY